MNARRNVPNVDGARTPPNTLRIPPWRSRSKSEIESAPATIPNTTASSFVAAFAAGTESRSSSAGSPARVASADTGISPAHDTRLGSSNRTETCQRS